MTYQVNETMIPLQRVVNQANIAMFDTSRNNPALNIRYDLLTAFPMDRTGVAGVKKMAIYAQKLTGSGVPSVVVTNNSNANVLKPVRTKQEILIRPIAHEVLLDKNEIEDGDIDANIAVSKTAKLLNETGLQLLIKGFAKDAKTNELININANSLINIGKKVVSTVNFSTAEATAINTFLGNTIDMTADAGYTANLLMISSKAFRAMGSAKATLAQDKVLQFLKDIYNLWIYPTEYLNDCGDLGACGIFYQNSSEVVEAVIGKEPFIRGEEEDNFNRRPAVQASFGGNVRNADNENAIITMTNLLG